MPTSAYRYTDDELAAIGAAIRSGDPAAVADRIWDPILLSHHGHRLVDSPSQVRPADYAVDADQHDQLGRAVSAAMPGMWLNVGPTKAHDGA